MQSRLRAPIADLESDATCEARGCHGADSKRRCPTGAAEPRLYPRLDESFQVTNSTTGVCEASSEEAGESTGAAVNTGSLQAPTVEEMRNPLRLGACAG